jgi:hypothetical protein
MLYPKCLQVLNAATYLRIDSSDFSDLQIDFMLVFRLQRLRHFAA